MKDKSVAIIGGGIVGLSLAYKLLQKGTKVTLYERESCLAFHQSGNNSGVLHSGIAYPIGSLKSKLCLDGYEQMIKYCSENNVHYRLCGKYLFAENSSQFDYLHSLYKRALKIGLRGVKILNEPELESNVPELVAKKALWIPQTGIVDYRQVCESLASSIDQLGGVIKLNSKIESVKEDEGKLLLQNKEYTFDHIIVAAGNNTISLSSNQDIKREFKLLSIKGEYYTTSTPQQIDYCVYPLPDPELPFLGLHCHPDKKGMIEVGPTAIICNDEYQFERKFITIDNIRPLLRSKEARKMVYRNLSFTFDQILLRFSKRYFAHKVRTFLKLSSSELVYKRSGIRAQVVNSSGILINDFKINRFPKTTFLINVPSPAATASLAIADFIINQINFNNQNLKTT